MTLSLISIFGVFLGVAASYSKLYLAHLFVPFAALRCFFRKRIPELFYSMFFLALFCSFFWADNPSQINYAFYYLFGFLIVYIVENLEYEEFILTLRGLGILLCVEVVIGLLESFQLFRFPISELSSHLPLFGKPLNPYLSQLEPDSWQYLSTSPTGFHWGTNNYACVILAGSVFYFFFANAKKSLGVNLVTCFLIIMASSRILYWVHITILLALWIYRNSFRYLMLNLVGIVLITGGIYYLNTDITKFKAYDCVRLPLVVWEHVAGRNQTQIHHKQSSERVSGATNQSQVARLQLMKHSLSMAKQRPLFGHGLGANNYSAEPTNAWSPHNLFLEILVDAGIFGLSLYFAIFGWLGLLSYRQGKSVFVFFLAISSVLWVTGLVVSSVVYFLPYYLGLGLLILIVTKGYGRDLFSVDFK